MSFDLDAYLDEELTVFDAVDFADGDGGRPTAADIWLYKLEDAVTTLVNHWAHKKPPEAGYDSFCLYAHHFCLKSSDDVSRAPDRVLFEAMGLDGGPFGWGWLQFIIRDLGWHSMLAANWGLPTLVIPDGVTYDTTTEEQRRAQAVAYFIQVMRDLRGRDVVADWRGFAYRFSAKYAAMYGLPLAPERLLEWTRERKRCYYTTLLATYADNPNSASVLSKPGKPAYDAKQAAEFHAKIRDAASRRRGAWDADWSCDCARRRKEAEERDGRAQEGAGVEHVLKGDAVTHRGDDIGIVPAGEELAHLSRHFEAWMSSEPNIRNTYLHDRLEIFLARNPRARELLRRPENRALAAQVKREVRWLDLPGWTFKEGGGVSHMAA